MELKGENNSLAFHCGYAGLNGDGEHPTRLEKVRLSKEHLKTRSLVTTLQQRYRVSRGLEFELEMKVVPSCKDVGQWSLESASYHLLGICSPLHRAMTAVLIGTVYTQER
jgi:hypothetical protein